MHTCYEKRVQTLIEAMGESSLYQPFKVDHGSVGQTYPRAYAKIVPPATPDQIIDAMKERNIFIGYDSMEDAICLSPQNITDEECLIVADALKSIVDEIEISFHHC